MIRVSLIRSVVATMLGFGSIGAPGLTGRWATSLWFTPFPLGTGRSIRRRHRAGRHLVAASAVIDGWEVGEGDRTALLVHGWGGASRQFDRMAVALADDGFRVFLIDLPGHGPAAGASTDVAELAEAIRHSIVAIDRSVGRGSGVDLVVAHSLGALAAGYAMADGAEVGAVVLIAPGISPLHAMARFAEDLSLSPRAVARIRSAMERRFGPDVWEAAPRTVLDLDLDGRSLVVHDRTDDRVPFAAGSWLASALGAELLATDGLGHNGVLRAPEVLDAVVSFASLVPSSPESGRGRHPA